MRTHRWAVDLEWLAGHNGGDDQELADSGSDISAPEWSVRTAEGKQWAKEVYQAKPTGPTQGVPDTWTTTQHVGKIPSSSDSDSSS
jgi:hypothetical protein